MGSAEAIVRSAPLAASWRFLTHARGDRKWDILLRSTAVFALAGIPVALYVPDAIPLVWLVLLGMPANGPLSPILPTAFEPLIMEAAKYKPALVVGAVATAVYIYMEYLNFHLYRWVLLRDRLEKFRTKGWVQRAVTAFGRWPFATVIIFAVTPLPFWVARILAILKSYSIPRFMVATAIGRFPRFFLYAWLGEILKVPAWALIAVVVGGGVGLVGWRLIRGKPAFTGADGDEGELERQESEPGGAGAEVVSSP
jgi:membrane protein YqaA with SNARE-associated domain